MREIMAVRDVSTNYFDVELRYPALLLRSYAKITSAVESPKDPNDKHHSVPVVERRIGKLDK